MNFIHPLVKAKETGLSDCSQTEYSALSMHCVTAGTKGHLGNLSSGVSRRPLKCRLPAGCFLKQAWEGRIRGCRTGRKVLQLTRHPAVLADGPVQLAALPAEHVLHRSGHKAVVFLWCLSVRNDLVVTSGGLVCCGKRPHGRNPRSASGL